MKIMILIIPAHNITYVYQSRAFYCMVSSDVFLGFEADRFEPFVTQPNRQQMDC